MTRVTSGEPHPALEAIVWDVDPRHAPDFRVATNAIVTAST